LFFKRMNGGLNIWISWVDNLLNVGEAKVNEKEKEEFKKKFDCDDVGELIEFVGVKIVIDRVNQTAKLVQPVLLQALVMNLRLDQVMWIFQPRLDMSSVISAKMQCIWTPKSSVCFDQVSGN
jgi:hypothetical protein